jgi:hypothetical protein
MIILLSYFFAFTERQTRCVWLGRISLCIAFDLLYDDFPGFQLWVGFVFAEEFGRAENHARTPLAESMATDAIDPPFAFPIDPPLA